MEKNKLYFLALIEGAFVVSIELLGGKLIAPVFGSSLYIWTSIIGVTLLSLTIGYFIGGILSSKQDHGRKLFILFSVAVVSALMMPLISSIFFDLFIDMNLFAGCIITAILLLACPLICLGATSPLLIQASLDNESSGGKIAGRFYAISSFGGIVNTFLLGFFLIPSFGIRGPLLISCLLVLTAILFLSEVNYREKFITVFCFVIISIQMLFKTLETKESSSFKDIYESEGIMGQLKVVDFVSETGNLNRALLNNNSAQSIITKTNVTAISQYNYVHFISSVASMKTENSEVLLLGMAGGSLVYEMQNQKFNIDVVDIDERTFYVAERYFYFQKNRTRLFVDDARHFIKTAPKKYDIIIIDISSSEVQPSYLYTQECFSEIKKALNPGGLFFINFQGVLQGRSNLALATWSVFNTLEISGFKSYYYAFSSNKTDDVQFVSSQNEIDFSQMDSSNVNLCCSQNKHVLKLLRGRKLNDSRALCEVTPLILTDDKPQLERLKFETVVNSRNEIRKEVKKREALIRKIN